MCVLQRVRIKASLHRCHDHVQTSPRCCNAIDNQPKSYESFPNTRTSHSELAAARKITANNATTRAAIELSSPDSSQPIWLACFTT